MADQAKVEPQHWVILDTNAVQVEAGCTPFDGILGTLKAGHVVMGYHLAIPQMVLLEQRMRHAPSDSELKLAHARQVWNNRGDKELFKRWACRILEVKDEHHEETLIRDLAKRAPFDNRGRGARDTRTWLAILDFIKERPHIAQISLITNDRDFYLDRARTALHSDLIADLNHIGFPVERIQVFHDADVFFERVIQPSSKDFAEAWEKTACEVIPNSVVMHLDEMLRTLVQPGKDVGETLPLHDGPENWEYENEQWTITDEPIIKFGEIEALAQGRGDSRIARFTVQVLIDVVEGTGFPEDGHYDGRRAFDSRIVVEWNPQNEEVRAVFMGRWVANHDDSMAMVMCSQAWEYEEEQEERRQKVKAWKRDILRRAEIAEHGIPVL